MLTWCSCGTNPARLRAQLSDVLDQHGALDQTETVKGSPREARHPAPFKAAASLTSKGIPVFRMPYRAILLDRTLVENGIAPGEEAPPELLLTFDAKTRKRLELHYRTVHVCPSCYLYYLKHNKEMYPRLQKLIPPLVQHSKSKQMPHGATHDGRSGLHVSPPTHTRIALADFVC